MPSLSPAAELRLDTYAIWPSRSVRKGESTRAAIELLEWITEHDELLAAIAKCAEREAAERFGIESESFEFPNSSRDEP